MRQHRTNTLVPHDASDEVHKSTGLVATIPGAAASSPVPADHVLLVRAGYSSDQTPQIETGPHLIPLTNRANC